MNSVAAKNAITATIRATHTVVSRNPAALGLFRARVSFLATLRLFCPFARISDGEGRTPRRRSPTPFDDYIALYDTRYPLSEILRSKLGRISPPCIGGEIYLHQRWVRKRAHAYTCCTYRNSYWISKPSLICCATDIKEWFWWKT